MVAGHAERLGGLQFHHVMNWLEALGIPRAPARMDDLLSVPLYDHRSTLA
jgi:hypothetical protein